LKSIRRTIRCFPSVTVSVTVDSVLAVSVATCTPSAVFTPAARVAARVAGLMAFSTVARYVLVMPEGG